MKRIKVLALALVMALMLMGVGYAYWQDTITLESTVKTGTFDVAWGLAGCSVTIDPNSAYGGANVAHLSAAGITLDAVDTDKLVMEIQNLFPGATGVINLFLDNRGTVPARFQDMALTFDPAVDPGDFRTKFGTQFSYSTDNVAWTPIVAAYTDVGSLAGLVNADAGFKTVVLDAGNYLGPAPVDGDDLWIKIPFKVVDDLGGGTIGAEQFEGQTLKLIIDFDFEQWVKN